MSGRTTIDDTMAREDFILGRPPRIAPLDPEKFTPEAEQLILDIRAITESTRTRAQLDHPDYVPPPIPTIVPTMARHPDLFRIHTEMGVQLMARGILPIRDREIAILRVGWLCRAPYEWGEHVRASRIMGLLTPEETERITVGSAAPGWTDGERAILMAVEELFADAMISDETWAALAAQFDEAQLMELLLLIGQYQAVAYFQNSIRLELHEGNMGLKAR